MIRSTFSRPMRKCGRQPKKTWKSNASLPHHLSARSEQPPEAAERLRQAKASPAAGHFAASRPHPTRSHPKTAPCFGRPIPLKPSLHWAPKAISGQPNPPSHGPTPQPTRHPTLLPTADPAMLPIPHSALPSPEARPSSGRATRRSDVPATLVKHPPKPEPGPGRTLPPRSTSQPSPEPQPNHAPEPQPSPGPNLPLRSPSQPGPQPGPIPGPTLPPSPRPQPGPEPEPGVKLGPRQQPSRASTQPTNHDPTLRPNPGASVFPTLCPATSPAARVAFPAMHPKQNPLTATVYH